MEIQSGVIYQFTCGGCNASYIGQTSRHLRTTISEHQGVGTIMCKALGSSQFSVIREHSLECNGVVDPSK